MKTYSRSGLLIFILLLLTACGGGGDAPMVPHQASLSAISTARAPLVAADYGDVVQKIYVGYFGRPADSGGLKFYEDIFVQANGPTTIAGLNTAYDTNPAIRSVVDGFGTSAESMSLYSGDNTAFITAIYLNLFRRPPDPGGLAFWVTQIENGNMNRARAAITLIGSAAGTDIVVINKRTQVASNFTAQITTPIQVAGYVGQAAGVAVRTMLDSVVFDTDVAAFQPTITATLASLAATAGANSYATVASVISTRCTGCHSATPTIPGFNPAPKGVIYDNSSQVHAGAAAIVQQTVTTQTMPFGNITGMTDAERAAIKSWADLGAP